MTAALPLTRRRSTPTLLALLLMVLLCRLDTASPLSDLERAESDPAASSNNKQQDDIRRDASSSRRSLLRHGNRAAAGSSVASPPASSSTDNHKESSMQQQQRALQQDGDKYQKCYDTLDEIVVNEEGVMTQQNYVAFLRQISGGRIAATSFKELSTVFVLLYYSTACSGGRNCVDAAPPTISLDRTGDSGIMLFLLCRQVLTYTYTTVDLSFEYTVRYDTAVTTSDRVMSCLARATENLLLDQVGTCSNNHQRQLLRDNDDDDKTNDDLSEFWQDHGSRDLLLVARDFVSLDDASRLLSSLPHNAITTSTATTTNSLQPQQQHRNLKNCAYTVEVQIRGLSDMACEDAPASDTAAMIQCALARSSATVVAEQLAEPDAGALRAKIVSVLRQAINSDDGVLETYLPSGCLLAN